MGRGRDVCAHRGLGIKIGNAVLNGQALNGVRIIRRPDLGGKAEHSQVKPVAAGGAAFQQNVRPGRENPAKHIVQAKNEIMGLRPQRHGMAVHVPLDVGNAGAVQNPGDILHDIIPHLRLGQVQQQLIAPQHRLEAVRQRPVRMRAVEVGVGIYGFRLEPESEGKSPVLQVPGQSFQPLGELLPVHGVVSQPGTVIVPPREPTVVQYEQFTAQRLRPVGQTQQTVLAEIKGAALPAVVQHRPGTAAPMGRDDMVGDEGVHIGRQPAEALT